MKRVAEHKPIVRVVEVLDPIQVRLALRIVPPDIARVAVAIEGYVRMPSVPLLLEYSQSCIVFGI